MIKIKENIKEVTLFGLPQTSSKYINQIIKSRNSKKTTGPDGISIKVIKTVVSTIDSYLSNIIAKNNQFSENVKTALVRSISETENKFRLKVRDHSAVVTAFSCCKTSDPLIIQ